VFAHCAVERPPLIPLRASHAACWLYEDAPAMAEAAL
jgi:hypothetical protein